jgi:hypothetical protein
VIHGDSVCFRTVWLCLFCVFQHSVIHCSSVCFRTVWLCLFCVFQHNVFSTIMWFMCAMCVSVQGGPWLLCVFQHNVFRVCYGFSERSGSCLLCGHTVLFINCFVSFSTYRSAHVCFAFFSTMWLMLAMCFPALNGSYLLCVFQNNMVRVSSICFSTMR